MVVKWCMFFAGHMNLLERTGYTKISNACSKLRLDLDYLLLYFTGDVLYSSSTCSLATLTIFMN